VSDVFSIICLVSMEFTLLYPYFSPIQPFLENQTGTFLQASDTV